MLALWLKVCTGKINVRQFVRALGSRKIKAPDTKSRDTTYQDTVTDPFDAKSVQGMSTGEHRRSASCGSSSGGCRKWTSPDGTIGVGLGQ